MRRVQPADSSVIAGLHRDVISWGLLSHLGERVVTGFYRAVCHSDVAFCFVAEEDGTPVGFAAGVSDWPRLFWQVVRHTWWPLCREIPALVRSGRWRRLRETARYTQSGLEGVRAEFLSLGVREDVPGRLWAGAALAYAVIGEFRRRGVPKIRGVVWDQNERALKFFKAVGFQFISQVEIHPGEMSRAFVMDLHRRNEERDQHGRVSTGD